jgi:uncharacterized protein (TIGR03435 family)
MAQTLLRDRFGLVARFEPRQMDASDLVAGKDGIKMRAVEPLDELTKDFTTSSGQQPPGDLIAP